uniref:uncharacterized protein LOC122608519 n=1 Tax=Erigeron canadensis TaxID=72917 RepID=UPI001CB93C0D|nr:uncharacterized protein LOC122608519 [Erigeron canadensis]
MKHNQKNLMIKIITTPYRAICKAKDFYIRSITECTTPSISRGPVRTFGNPISRSSSTSSFGSSAASEDLRELIRANSTARMGDLNINRADLEMYIKQHIIMKQSAASSAIPIGSRKVPRSVSVGMGRIDEEMPVSSFPEIEELSSTRKAKSDLMFPRSKSHAVTSSSKINRYS